MRNHLRRNEVRIPVALTSALLAIVATVTACSGSGSAGSGSAATAAASASASASASTSTGRRGFGGGAFGTFLQQADVKTCLKAAGVAVPTFAARPSGSFTRPSGSFPRPSGSFPRPSGSFPRPSGSFPRPSGAFPSGARPAGGFAGGADFTKIEAALKACGIALPTGVGARPSGSPASS